MSDRQAVVSAVDADSDWLEALLLERPYLDFEAFREGCQAFVAGISSTRNPYRGDDAERWDDGWMMGQCRTICLS